MPDARPILFILGLLLLALAASMLLPLALDALGGVRDWQGFAVSAAITAGVGGALVLGYRRPEAPSLTLREGFVFTVAAWLLLCAFSTLPFLLAGLGMGLADAFFEAMSGLTTTGATVMTDLAALPRGLLLWRAMLHWIGGIGIIVTAVAILPVLRVGGMQLFRMEFSEKHEKVRPRVSQVSGMLISVYVTLTAIGAVSLVAAGMPPFDAVCHAMSMIATGGFSTQDASIGFYRNPAVEWIVSFFMLLGGSSFIVLAGMAQGHLAAFFRDSQTRWYLVYLLAFIAVIALWQMLENGRPSGEAIRSSVFNVISIATGTGFASEDYTLWGSLPIAAFFVLFFIGGCTGSTAGGIKVFRYCVLGSVALWQIRHLVHPHRVVPPTYNGRPISDDVVRSVLSFFVFYIGCYAVISMGVAAFGLDLVTSISAAAQALGNVGPGLGPIIGPAGNYAPLPEGAKWLLSAAMLLGRLELLTILVLFSATFWRG